MSQAEEEAEKVAKKVIRQLMGGVVEKTVSDEDLLKAYVRNRPHNDKKDTPARKRFRRYLEIWGR